MPNYMTFCAAQQSEQNIGLLPSNINQFGWNICYKEF
jgi:hypothetical protein